MKSQNGFYVMFIFVVIIVSMSTPSIAFAPIEKKVVVTAVSDGYRLGTKLYVGIQTNITIIVKNFSNETMRQVNISQSMPVDLTIVDSSFGNLTTLKEINSTKPFNYTTFSGSQITFGKLFINSTYYNFTINSIFNGTGFSFAYAVNSSLPKSYDISPVQVKYLDHWGDTLSLTSNTLKVAYKQLPASNGNDLYIPKFSEGVIDWNTYILVSFITAFVAVVSVILYGRKPLSL